MKTKIIIVAVVIIAIAGIWWSKSAQNNDPNIIATNGIHWHPELQIFVKGQEVTIPQNIGLSPVESSIHTHEDLPLIHLEFGGRVTKDDIKIKKFFEVWGKDFMSFGSNVTMTVNGVPNTELGNYVMQDGDKIVLNYE